MFRWVPYPFLRFTPALILGVLIGLYLPIRLSLFSVALLFVAYVALVIFIPPKRRYQLATVTGLLGLITVAAIGVARVQQCDMRQQTTHLLHYSSPYSHYVATVTSDAERRTNSWRVTARLEYVLSTDSISASLIPTPLQANLLFYQPVADSLHRLAYGDRIIVKGHPALINSPANPYAFDLQQYWATQEIAHQQYLQLRQWQKLENNPPNRLTYVTTYLRRRSRELLTQAIPNPEARGVALALVLGAKEQLEERVREAYGRAGAMHVLAVSGLHMGIVYGVVAFLLMPLRRMRWGKAGHALMCIVTLWLFALVTGASVSVLRAATMFTCIIVADATQRRSNIFNTLALSAFLLILINPYYLLSVGFQLSYLAVLGIVYLQPRLYRLVTCRYGWLDKVWGLTTVSVAAQIATLPISLYYFHQFPTYFWLANLIVIPAAFVILSLGLLTVGIGSAAPSMITWLGQALETVVAHVNALIFSLGGLPFSQFERLYVTLPQVLGLYACIIAFVMLFRYRTFPYLVYGCGFLLSVTALEVYYHWQQQQRTSITFYQVRGQSNVDFTVGHTNYHWGVWNEPAVYQIETNHIQAGATTTFLDSTSFPPSVPFLQHDGMALVVWQNQRLAFVRSPLHPATQRAEKIPVDYLVVSNNAVRSLSTLNRHFSYAKLIIDSSNSTYRARQLAAEATTLALPYHCVPTQGAYEILL